jgi:hypothetical protein
VNCRQEHGPELEYNPGLHSDTCLANVMGPVYRSARGQLLEGGDMRVWMLPCPRCAPTKPVFMVLDVRVDRYRCAVCNWEMPVSEVEEAAGGVPLEVI